MNVVTASGPMRSVVRAWREAGLSVALVPTMGNIHAGHLALVERARVLAARTLVSIFVNPAQFVAGEDYARYPRTLAQDSVLLEQVGPDLLYAPAIEDLYPLGLDRHTRIEVPALDGILCGASRPGHFAGVATVVAKLFNLVRPDVALFGAKDYQQLLVIKRLCADLCFDLKIEAVATVREADGLALSSRNGYLDSEERALAPRLYKALSAASSAIVAGNRDYAGIEAKALTQLTGQGFAVDYLSIRRAEDLGVPDRLDTDLVVLAAVWLGQTRLIDNVLVHVTH